MRSAIRLDFLLLICACEIFKILTLGLPGAVQIILNSDLVIGHVGHPSGLCVVFLDHQSLSVFEFLTGAVLLSLLLSFF